MESLITKSYSNNDLLKNSEQNFLEWQFNSNETWSKTTELKEKNVGATL